MASVASQTQSPAARNMLDDNWSRIVIVQCIETVFLLFWGIMLYFGYEKVTDELKISRDNFSINMDDEYLCISNNAVLVLGFFCQLLFGLFLVFHYILHAGIKENNLNKLTSWMLFNLLVSTFLMMIYVCYIVQYGFFNGLCLSLLSILILRHFVASVVFGIIIRSRKIGRMPASLIIQPTGRSVRRRVMIRVIPGGKNMFRVFQLKGGKLERIMTIKETENPDIVVEKNETVMTEKPEIVVEKNEKVMTEKPEIIVEKNEKVKGEENIV